MAEPHDFVILGTAGHIDHGKTALVKALTGFDTDRLPEEKRRGITIELGFARLSADGVDIAVIDVPGHERFVRNMLAGAGGFDIALLVVAADDGVMPQTIEHLEILKLLGLTQGIVVLTKCDLVPDDWQDLVEDDLRTRLAGSFLADAPIVRVSVVRGVGVERLRRELFEMAARFRRPARPSPFRMSVDRVFVKSGHGVVVTGSVGAGTVSVGDTLRLHPGDASARVRSLQSHGQSVESAGVGQRLAVNLTGIKGDAVDRGVEIASPDFLVDSRWLAVRLAPIPAAPARLKHRGVYRLHIGAADVPAKLILPQGAEMSGDSPTVALLRTAEPIAAVYGRPFVIRGLSPAMTLAGGQVLWPTARLVRRRDLAEWRLLGDLNASAHDQKLAAWMTLTRSGRPDAATAMRELSMTHEEVAEAARLMEISGRLVRLRLPGSRGETEITSESAERLLSRMRRRLAKFHAEYPRLTAMTIRQLAGRFADVSPEVVTALLDSEMAGKLFVARDGMVSLSGFVPQLTQAERRLRNTLWEAIRAGGFAPPLIDEFAKSTGAKPSLLLDLLHLLVDEGLAAEIGGGLFVTADIAQTIRDRISGWFAGHESMTVAELRDLLGISRKYAVPLAEWLDKSGVTRREGDLRFPSIPPHAAPLDQATP
jgi:selenocysteine-specific elongation factor